MNILEVIRARIIQAFPRISEEELSMRLNIAQELLKLVERKYD